MKRLILVSLFIFPLIISAQNYIPIPCDSTSEWRVKQQTHSKGPCLDIVDLRYFFNGDTTINLKNYFKLYETGIYYQQNTGPTSYCDPTIHHFHDAYVGLIRNDSNKVYFIPYGNSSEILLFDFSLTIGDTVPGYNPYKISILSIDSVLINSSYHKRFNLDYNHWIIEGIGSDLGLIESMWSTFEAVFQFLCYAENHNPVFPTGVNCILNVNTEGELVISNDELQIFPNPANDNLHIEFSENTTQQNLKITVYNSIGIKVKSIEAKNNLELDIKDLKSGIYFIQVQTENKSVFNSNFIKL